MDHPFDARRAMLIDEGKPHNQRRPVSLVTALRANLLHDPELTSEGDGEQRRQAIRLAVSELTERGLDGDCLLRYGLGPEVAGSVLSLLLPRRFPESKIALHLDPADAIQRRNSASTKDEDLSAWEELLLGDGGILSPIGPSPPVPTVRDIATFMAKVSVELMPWIMSAPMDDLITLKPPTLRELRNSRKVAPLDVSIIEEYRWAVERFAITHLTDWSTSSLHLEYRWVNGRHPAPCDPKLMTDRAVSLVDLQAEIALRATSKTAHEFEFGPVGMATALTSKMHNRAVELLRQHRHRDAATLYEFALSQNPEDSHAANNLGFCLIPDDPRSALRHLTTASNLGYSFPATNLYNRALCHHLMNDYHSTITLIKESWQEIQDEYSAILWIPTIDGFTLQESSSPRKELAKLAYMSAARLGSQDEEKHWRQVFNSLV